MPIKGVKMPGSEFYDTYKMYCNYIGYDKSKPYSYETWMKLDNSRKCAALYCQFYFEITLAWYKVSTSWNTEAEGVEEIHKYLLKNVGKIEEDKKRFSPKYIYRVSWNCFDCLIPKWVPRLKWRIENEVNTEYVGNDGVPFSVFDFVSDGKSDKIDDIIFSKANERCYNDELSEDTKLYVDYLFGIITEYKFLQAIKKMGIISCPIRRVEDRKAIMGKLAESYGKAIKLFVMRHLDDCNYSSYLDVLSDDDRHLIETDASHLAYETIIGKFGKTNEEVKKNLDFRYEDVRDLLCKFYSFLQDAESKRT